MNFLCPRCDVTGEKADCRNLCIPCLSKENTQKQAIRYQRKKAQKQLESHNREQELAHD